VSTELRKVQFPVIPDSSRNKQVVLSPEVKHGPGANYMVEPALMRSDTACFDLESRPEWLLISQSGFLMGFRGLSRTANAEFSSERLWLEGLEERLEQKAVLVEQTR